MQNIANHAVLNNNIFFGIMLLGLLVVYRFSFSTSVYTL